MNLNQLLFSTNNYKDVIKLILEKLKEDGKNLSNKELANKIPIQSTYLSKFFNDENSH